MKTDFDFNQIGKRMPYQTPESFFDDMETQIWKEVQSELPQASRRKRFRLRIIAGALAVAASITLLFILHPFFHTGQHTEDFSSVEQAFANLSGEDQAYMLEVYQEDIFMN